MPLPEQFWIHEDVSAALAAHALGCAAFTQRDRIYLGAIPPEMRRHVIRHELVHLAQVQHGLRSGRVDSRSELEREAERLAGARVAGPVTRAAHPEHCYGFWWVPIGIGVYILLRPSVANAPAPDSRLRRSPSLTQITTEAVAFMVVPGGACTLGARIGLGFWGQAMWSGALAGASTRVVQDAFEGELSPPLFYVHDIATGAILGFVVPGGVRLVGYAGTKSLDWLANLGLERAQIEVIRRLRDLALSRPNGVGPDEVNAVIDDVMKGRMAQLARRWYERQNVVWLARGQGAASTEILSPLAREEGVIASNRLLDRARLDLPDDEIAGYSARYSDGRIPNLPENLVGERLGAIGIPTSDLMGIAAGYAGPEGVVYILRVPRSGMVDPIIWPNNLLEFEKTIFSVVPPGTIVKAIPASRIAPISVNGDGNIVGTWKKM